MKASPKVLIVILNYLTYQLTLELVEDLHKNLIYPAYDILVVDNASPNESGNYLDAASAKSGFLFIQNDKNTGYAAGNNTGIRYAIQNGYDYTWILNNDVKLTEQNTLSKLVYAAEASSNVGCVGPKLFSLEGTPIPPYCKRPTVWSMTLGIWNEKKFRKKNVDTSQKVYRVYGCCMLLKNQIMQQVDCMDERTFLYCEEEILAERMLQQGYVSYYCANTSMIHMESMTVRKVFSKSAVIKKIKMVDKSFDLYLREYRNFHLISRFFCKLVRYTLLALRS